MATTKTMALESGEPTPLRFETACAHRTIFGSQPQRGIDAEEIANAVFVREAAPSRTL